MTTECGFCKGTGKEEGFDGCVWCCNTGQGNGLSAEVMSDLKPFRFLPYGAKFRYRGAPDVWVRTGHNLVAEWPSRVSAADGTPIQSLCCFCHLDGDDDGNTLDTLVEVIDHESERDAALGREARAKEGLTEHWKVVCDQRAKIEALQQRLTVADEQADVLEGLLRRAKPYIPWNRFGTVQYQWNLEVRDALSHRSDGDIPDFSPGNGNKARRRAQAIAALALENQRIVPCNPDANEPPCSACFVRGCNGECMENL